MLGQAQQVPQLLASVRKPDGPADYWKLTSVVQAADAALWPVQVAGMPWLDCRCGAALAGCRCLFSWQCNRLLRHTLPELSRHPGLSVQRKPLDKHAWALPSFACDAGQLGEADFMWWSDLLKALDERLGKSRQAAAVRRVVSTIRNNYGERCWQNTGKVAWKRKSETPTCCSAQML